MLEKDNNALAISPTLQDPNTPELSGMESSHNGLLVGANIAKDAFGYV
ncbi:MAG: hypothetical protein QNL14_05050 [Deltaproteobacteria bacterium]|nr:hypothetical protein [Deltaproteobacteria bacterium]